MFLMVMVKSRSLSTFEVLGEIELLPSLSSDSWVYMGSMVIVLLVE